MRLFWKAVRRWRGEDGNIFLRQLEAPARDALREPSYYVLRPGWYNVSLSLPAWWVGPTHRGSLVRDTTSPRKHIASGFVVCYMVSRGLGRSFLEDSSMRRDATELC